MLQLYTYVYLHVRGRNMESPTSERSTRLCRVDRRQEHESAGSAIPDLQILDLQILDPQILDPQFWICNSGSEPHGIQSRHKPCFGAPRFGPAQPASTPRIARPAGATTFTPTPPKSPPPPRATIAERKNFTSPTVAGADRKRFPKSQRRLNIVKISQVPKVASRNLLTPKSGSQYPLIR